MTGNLVVQDLENPAPVTMFAVRTKEQAMTVLKNDLYRNLGLGFLLGAIGVVLTNPSLAQAVTALV